MKIHLLEIYHILLREELNTPWNILTPRTHVFICEITWLCIKKCLSTSLTKSNELEISKFPCEWLKQPMAHDIQRIILSQITYQRENYNYVYSLHVRLESKKSWWTCIHQPILLEHDKQQEGNQFICSEYTDSLT